MGNNVANKWVFNREKVYKTFYWSSFCSCFETHKTILYNCLILCCWFETDKIVCKNTSFYCCCFVETHLCFNKTSSKHSVMIIVSTDNITNYVKYPSQFWIPFPLNGVIAPFPEELYNYDHHLVREGWRLALGNERLPNFWHTLVQGGGSKV